MTDNPSQAPTPEPEKTPSIEELQKQIQKLTGEATGSRGYAAKLQSDLAALKAQHDSLTTEHEGLKVASAQRQTLLEAREKELAASLSEKEAALAKTQRTLDQNKLIADKFGDLLPFQVKGQLRTDLEGEAYEAYLKDFQATIQGIASSAAEMHVKGATPTPPAPSTVADDQQDMYSKLMHMNPNTPEYAELHKRYLEAVSKSTR